MVEQKQDRRHRNLISSFFSACRGLMSILKIQKNVRIIFACGILAILLGIYLKVTILEILILLLTIGLVCVAEIFNTMVEEVINLITDRYDRRIKLIKDISAGAVLIASIISLIVGYFIFIRRLLIF
ncbi:MAG: diacylglycerol kinase family protein [Candidatus Omnitrophica bacterium]|nr:diacylglycerol kinase family protein [Candidatus Omnitrophota bacterium]